MTAAVADHLGITHFPPRGRAHGCFRYSLRCRQRIQTWREGRARGREPAGEFPCCRKETALPCESGPCTCRATAVLKTTRPYRKGHLFETSARQMSYLPHELASGSSFRPCRISAGGRGREIQQRWKSHRNRDAEKNKATLRILSFFFSSLNKGNFSTLNSEGKKLHCL